MNEPDDLPQGSVASRIFEARNTPRAEAERAERRLADAPTPAGDSPTALVFDRPGVTWPSIAAAGLCAIILHGGLLAVTTAMLDTDGHTERRDPSPPAMEVRHVVQMEPEPQPEPQTPPAPPEPEAPSPPPETTPKPSPDDPEPSPKPTSKPPSESKTSESAKPAAKAGDVIEATSEAEQVADFTNFEVPQGEADSFSGGVTASSGSSDDAVRGSNVSADGDSKRQDGDSGEAGRAVGIDQTDWTCPWPERASELSVDEQVVVLRAVVRPDGTPASVSLVSDPGFGFGKAALECARSHRFRPALDKDGNPYRATSPPIRVRFTR